MSSANALIDALKRVLKAHGMTYREVAAVLELSEASVKRLFSSGGFTLERVEQICDALEITIGDLVREAQSASPALSRLSAEQERELVADERLLMAAVLAIEGWSFAQIVASYAITEPQLVQLLARLDRLRLIELLPGNRIRRLVAPNFGWIADGPIEGFFAGNVRAEFLRSRFAGPGESLRFVYGMLSARSNAVVQRRMEQLAREFDELRREDMHLPLAEREGCSLMCALRPWDFFARLRREA